MFLKRLMLWYTLGGVKGYLVVGIVDHWGLPLALVVGVVNHGPLPCTAAGGGLTEGVRDLRGLPLAIHVLIPGEKEEQVTTMSQTQSYSVQNDGIRLQVTMGVRKQRTRERKETAFRGPRKGVISPYLNIGLRPLSTVSRSSSSSLPALI